MTKKLLIFIVTYNAETTLPSVLERIPKTLFGHPDLSVEILVIDDCSRDQTFDVGSNFQESRPDLPLRVIRNPVNLGYGGNQKVGYLYAIKNGFDYVALIHGDGQYAPEELPRLLKPLQCGEADVVFGSRMMSRLGALRGGMPLYKYLGNRILTAIQNLLVATKLTEYHSGYRIYSCSALQNIPFSLNSEDFDFDTDIIIQLSGKGYRIKELPIPTYYGDEVCHVNGLKYAAQIIRSSLIFRFQKFGLFYEPKFDLVENQSAYQPKFSFPSSHSLCLDKVGEGDNILLFGAPNAEIAKQFVSARTTLTVISRSVLDKEIEQSRWIQCDNYDRLDFIETHYNEGGSYNKIFLLDMLEQTEKPGDFLDRLRRHPLTRNALILITTPNAVFLPVRLMFFLGQLNYGKRGILDFRNRRLFTFSSLTKLIESHGLSIVSKKGIPAPFPLALSLSPLSRLLIVLNNAAICMFRGLFSYQIYFEVRNKPTLEMLLEAAEASGKRLAR